MQCLIKSVSSDFRIFGNAFFVVFYKSRRRKRQNINKIVAASEITI